MENKQIEEAAPVTGGWHTDTGREGTTPRGGTCLGECPLTLDISARIAHEAFIILKAMA